MFKSDSGIPNLKDLGLLVSDKIFLIFLLIFPFFVAMATRVLHEMEFFEQL